MKNAITVFKKEMRRFFTDRRMLAALFLPGVIIFLVYSLMGKFFTSAILDNKVTDTSYRIAYTDNYGGGEAPLIIAQYNAYLASSEAEKTNHAEYTVIPSTDTEATIEKVKQGQYDVFIAFSDNFETNIKTSVGTALENYVRMYYNGEKAAGSFCYATLSKLCDLTYKNYVVNVDSQGNPINPNVGKSEYTGTKIIGILLPVLTVSMLFSTVMSICPDSVAGEKERGTLSAVLLTPIKRSELVLGKIMALTVTATLSGLTSFIGLLGGVSNLIQGISVSFGPGQIILLGIMIVTTLILFVSLGLVVSTVSKSVRECSSLMSPFMILSMGAAILPLIITSRSPFLALVPFLNISLCMNSLITEGGAEILFIGLTVVSNLVFIGLLIFAVGKLFQKERFIVR